MNVPNILFINVDQQRYDCLGFTGNPIVKTPNIDNLAKTGISFSNAFTPIPLCCPARQTLLSGVMPDVHGGLWNFDCGSLNPPGLDSKRNIWVNQLKTAGYKTAYVGKWHVNKELDPTSFGFDSYKRFDGVPPESTKIKHHFDDEQDGFWGVGAYDTRPLEKTHTHQLAAEAVQTLEKFSETNSPWHIRLDFPEPHLPCWPAEPFASMYPPETIPEWENFKEDFKNKPFIQKQQLKNWNIENWTWKEWAIYMSGYYGMISQYDDAIGRVIKKVEELGLLENTLIIYSSDHGDAAGSHRMMDKHYVMYDEEIHVPMILRWDGKIKAETVCNDFTSHFLDLGPTILELLGLEISEDYQGKSFLPQLMGKGNPDAREFIFSTYNGQQFGLYSQRMVRDDKFKYVWNATDIDEFYDLENDPFELENIIDKSEVQEILKQYKKKLYNTFNELGDRLLQNDWMKNALLD